MKETMLVTGGCRSGKSAYAQRAAEQMAVTDRYFLATCQPADEEMRQRVARHQQDRGEQWQTRECPLDIEPVLRDMENDQAVVLVDCLTLWMSNLLAVTEDPAKIERRVAGLVEAVDQTVASVILVSNEVGCGIVPENRLARRFRDLAGRINQRAAARADRVVLCVSGIPVTIKG
ncbi:MAG: bifunctional adenosylcobinamide kinase/adenosylcobinamide-phosphate guanylyltransferase [Desulfosudaceae bacterium]